MCGVYVNICVSMLCLWVEVRIQLPESAVSFRSVGSRDWTQAPGSLDPSQQPHGGDF